MEWFGARCVFRVDTDFYEERVTVWYTESFNEVVALAEAEAVTYAEHVDGEYLGLVQVYRIPGELEQGAEVFSLMRESELDPKAYLDRFFDTGAEIQRDCEAGGAV